MPIHYEVDGELVDGLGRYAAGAWREEASR